MCYAGRLGDTLLRVLAGAELQGGGHPDAGQDPARRGARGAFVRNRRNFRRASLQYLLQRLRARGSNVAW